MALEGPPGEPSWGLVVVLNYPASYPFSLSESIPEAEGGFCSTYHIMILVLLGVALAR
jgi:hypothetical protein